MPPKPKPRKFPTSKKNIGTTQTIPEGGNSSMSPEAAEQFELELCWCIQQLQNALKTGKLNHKQTQDHIKAMNSLMSDSSPIVKKRQIMRVSFGDYRAKMAEEEKKFSSSASKIVIEKKTPNSKSVFVKKSKPVISNNLCISNLEDKFCFTPSGNEFRFNFNNIDK